MNGLPRQIRITREGWSFLSILTFIILGSIMRQINLLILLSGLMIAPFFFNWRIAMRMVERVRFRRQLPYWANARVPFVVQWTISNHRDQVTSWDLRLRDRIEPEHGKDIPVEQPELVAAQVFPGRSQSATYRCVLMQRGIYQYGPAELSCGFPLGLVRARIRNAQTDTLVVAPQPGVLTDQWTQLLRSSASGVRSQKRRRGLADDEFYALRPWRSGDSRRSIHWRSSAKRGDLLVKQYDQRTDKNFGIMLDLWNGRPESERVVERTLSFFTTVVASLQQQSKSDVVVGIVGDRVLLIRERITQPLLRDIMQHLSVLQPRNDNEFDDQLEQLANRSSRNLSLIVISSRRRRGALLSPVVANHVRVARWIDVSADEDSPHFQLNSERLDADELLPPAERVRPAFEI